MLHNYNIDFKLTSDAKIQPAITGREDSCFWLCSPRSRIGHALRPIFMLWLVKIWQVSLCGILNLVYSVYFDNWSWQNFESTCDVFNCLFPLDVQNEIQLLSRVFCYSWLVCLLGFWLRNAASWNLFTLTAEADRVFCQLVMFLTVFFHWMYKMKFSCYQESSYPASRGYTFAVWAGMRKV